MKEAMRWYIHPTARPKQIIKAIQLADRFSAEVEELKYPIATIPDDLKVVGVVGGDGSNRGVAEKLLERDDPGLLVVIPGGSQNGLYKNLVHEGITVFSQNLADLDREQIPSFKPGCLNEHTFTHVAEVGEASEVFSRKNEMLRGSRVPRDLRVAVAAVKTAFEQLSRGDNQPLIQVFAMGPNVGSYRLFSSQSFYGEDITTVSINAMKRHEVFPRIALLTMYAFLKKRPPKGIATVERRKEFVIDDREKPFEKIALGGDIFPLAPHGEIYVRRGEKSLKAVAVI